MHRRHFRGTVCIVVSLALGVVMVKLILMNGVRSFEREAERLFVVSGTKRITGTESRGEITDARQLLRARKGKRDGGKLKPLCPTTPPGLVGITPVKKGADWNEVGEELSNVKEGGRWKPANCTALHKVAIVVPYRDREAHLRVFIRHMHPFLQKQQLDYGIYIVEQGPGVKFNRGMLLNIGFVESSKLYDYECFAFHDVDLLPENDRNLYSCPPQSSPRHLSAAINKFHYKLAFETNFGGASTLTTEQMRKVNGFSNIYFGWGGEDNDMYRRVVGHGMQVTRYSPDVARYTMIKHGRTWQNPIRRPLQKIAKERWHEDGLVTNLRYTLSSLELRPLYTLVKVDIDEARVTEKYAGVIKKLRIQMAAKH